MKVIVSHTDLDGYVSSVNLERYLNEKYPATEDVVFYNVGYDELTKKLDIILRSTRKKPIHLAISDLNLKTEDYNKIITGVELLKSFTFIDHHPITDSEQYAELSRVLDAYNVEHRLIHSKNKKCASLLSYNLLAQQFVDDEKLHDLSELTDAWDRHDFKNLKMFYYGQLLNDYHEHIYRSVSGAGLSLDPNLRDWLIVKLTSALGISIQSVKRKNGFDFSTSVLEKRLLDLPLDVSSELEEECDCTDEERKRIGKIVSMDFGFEQKIGAITTHFLIKGVLNEYLEEHNGLNILISPMPLSRSVMHHVLYTFDVCDVLAVCHPDEKVELRRKGDNHKTPLGDIASEYSGGGHYNAAGLPWPDKLPIEKMVTMLQDTLKEYH